jgi:hypothetical protein
MAKLHHLAPASAETRLSQREAEAARAQSSETHTKQHECERQDAEAALQQSSALKEVQTMHLTKLRAWDGEDLDGMNIAPDSKQPGIGVGTFFFLSFYVLLFGMC